MSEEMMNAIQTVEDVVVPANTISEKRCSHCGKTLPVEKFYRSKQSKDGYMYSCKDCVNESKRRGVEDKRRKREEARLALAKQGVKNPSIMQVKREEARAERYAVPKTLDLYTARELLAELKYRGYVWTDMTLTQKVRYDEI